MLLRKAVSWVPLNAKLLVCLQQQLESSGAEPAAQSKAALYPFWGRTMHTQTRDQGSRKVLQLLTLHLDTRHFSWAASSNVPAWSRPVQLRQLQLTLLSRWQWQSRQNPAAKSPKALPVGAQSFLLIGFFPFLPEKGFLMAWHNLLSYICLNRSIIMPPKGVLFMQQNRRNTTLHLVERTSLKDIQNLDDIREEQNNKVGLNYHWVHWDKKKSIKNLPVNGSSYTFLCLADQANKMELSVHLEVWGTLKYRLGFTLSK